MSLKVLDKKSIVIEDNENEIIYILDSCGSIRIISNYEETFSNIETHDTLIVADIMKTMLDQVLKHISKDEVEI